MIQCFEFLCKGVFGEGGASCFYSISKANHYTNLYDHHREIIGRVLVIFLSSAKIGKMRNTKPRDNNQSLNIRNSELGSFSPETQ